MGINLNLAQFDVLNNTLSVKFEYNNTTFLINRALKSHEIERHLGNQNFSYYFLVQTALLDFEKQFERIQSILVTCLVLPGSPLHFVLFDKDWSTGPINFDTPLTRVKFKKVRDLPVRNKIHEG